MHLQPFFLLTPTGYTLSPIGLSARAGWLAYLRRVVGDLQEFYRLMYMRILPDEKRKKQQRKRFWKLDESEQIRILREYYSLPMATDFDKFQRKLARVKIFHEYGLRQFDIQNAINKFGVVVKSVRLSPEHAHKFPGYVIGHPGKPKAPPPPDPETIT